MIKRVEGMVTRGTGRAPWPARVGAILLIGLASSCWHGADDACLQDTVNIMTQQGVYLQGPPLLMQQQGRSLDGVHLEGMQLNGADLDTLRLDGSQLFGVRGDEQTVAGTDMVGTTMTGQLAGGGTLPLRVDAATTLPGPNGDVWAYAVSYRTEAGWSALCGTSDGAPILAIPLAGTWNARSGVAGGGSWTASGELFTFACRGAALAKCVELGYAPWKTAGGVPLRDHHQACTRMMRADYCGDGISWTQDGTLINVYDGIGVQADDATWAIDAEWTPDGAICADAVRDFRDGSPSCLADLQVRACGDFSSGALLIDEYDEGCAD